MTPHKWTRMALTADKAEFVPTFPERLFLLGKVDVLGASRANSGHLQSLGFRDGSVKIPAKKREKFLLLESTKIERR